MQGATPAIRALVRAGITHQIHEFEHAAGVTTFGPEAAAALGVEAARVYKTLIVEDAGGGLAVAVIPVTATLDLKAMAATLDVKRTALADAGAAERSSGYLVGAISPVGQKRELRTVIDESARSWDTILCSGGRRGLELELTATDLAVATGATFAAIARRVGG